MEDAPRLLKISRSECAQKCGYVFHDPSGPNHGHTWKTQSFLLNEILYAHPFAGLLWEGRFEEVLLGLGWDKVPNWKCLFGQRRQRFVLVGVRRWFWNGWKTAEHGSIVEEIDGTCWSWRTTSFLDHVYLGCTQRECNPNEDSVSQHRDEFLLPQLKNYQGGRNLTQKLSCGPATWKAMRKRAWRGIVNWQTKRRGNCTQFQRLAWMITTTWRRTWKQSENCPQMVVNCLYLALIGRLDILMVRKQACSRSHKMDKSLSQTLGSFVLSHSEHEWWQTMLPCAKYCTALQNGFVPRFWLCWRPWRLKVDLGRNYENLWESNIRSHRFDVQEANISVLQYYRIRDDITGCWFASGRYPCSWFVGCGDRSVTFVEWRTSSPKYLCIQKQTTRSREKLQAQHPKHQVEERRWPKRWSVVKSRLCDHKRSLFCAKAQPSIFWRQRTCDKDDHQRNKFDDETRV